MSDLQQQLEAAGVPEGLRRRVAALEAAALRDPLTGLHNRRFFDEALARATAAAKRYRRDLALVLFDLDGLKAINDTRGHAAGDAALKTLARVLDRSARTADTVCRIGGDEFAVILPETGEDGARVFAERVADCLKTLHVSFGAAALPADLFAAADAALLAAKGKKE